MSEDSVAYVAGKASGETLHEPTLAHWIALRAVCGDFTQARGDFLKVAAAHWILRCTPEALAAQYADGGWRQVEAAALAMAGGRSVHEVEAMAEAVAQRLSA